MNIVLKSYLARLEDEERYRPANERRQVPTITALADEINMSRPQLSRIFNGDVKSINLEIGSKIMAAIRKRGFDMRVTDMLEYRD